MHPDRAKGHRTQHAQLLCITIFSCKGSDLALLCYLRLEGRKKVEDPLHEKKIPPLVVRTKDLVTVTVRRVTVTVT